MHCAQYRYQKIRIFCFRTLDTEKYVKLNRGSNASVGTIEMGFFHEVDIQRQLNVKVACPLALPGRKGLPVRT